MFSKLVTKAGADQSPIYSYLGKTGSLPTWNFAKYLVDKDGKVVKFFNSKVTPEDPELRAAIDAALARSSVGSDAILEGPGLGARLPQRRGAWPQRRPTRRYDARRRSRASSSASPATPATACRSPAASSPNTAALVGNDLATFPDFPAEIRAPAGTLPGVSGFQIHFSSNDIYTPGDAPDVLVAMNPAALKVNIARPEAGRHPDRQHRHLQGDATSRRRGSPRTRSRTARSTATASSRSSSPSSRARRSKDLGLDAKSMDRCKNFFALGMMLLALQPPDGRRR